MGKIKRVLRCYNCGEVLQSENKDEKGYVEARLMKTTRDNLVIYCQRCFDKMKVINSGALEQNIDEETFKILDDARATDALIVWTIDLFTFNGTLPMEIVEKIKKLDILIVATKRDLFSKTISDEVFIRYIKERFNEYGIDPIGIKLTGAADEIDANQLLQRALQFRKWHDIYLIGSKASGKTVLINKLLKNYKNKTKWPIRTEFYPGTNQKVMSIPLTNSTFLYELPGISLATSVLGKVEKDILKQITPRKKVESFVRPMAKGDCLMVGNLAAFQLIDGKPTAFKFFSSESVETKKIRTKDLEDFLYENSKKVSVRPVSEHFTTFKDYDLFEYQMEDDDQLHDISVSGLGWISFVAKGQTIRVLLPHGVAVKESLAKIRK